MSRETGPREPSTFVLLHSPLVGPSTWRPVATWLRVHGHAVAVPSLVEGLAAGGSYHRALVEVASRKVPDRAVLVAHSGAGSLLSLIADEYAARGCVVDGLVYVDALLPDPGRTWFDGVPGDMGTRLRESASDGLLRPWHEWFPAEALAGLLPDEDQRAEIIAEITRVPVAYFDESAPESGLWPSAYLRLSAAYDEQAAQAQAWGWPTAHEDTDHLACATRPELVGDRIQTLAAALT